MNEKQLGVIKALATIFFQEGFDRNAGKHGLGYWCVSDEALSEHCKQCKIWEDDTIKYLLNTVQINGKWCVRLYYISFDEYGQADEMESMVYIPVDTGRLCWDEISKCAQIIYELIDEI